MSTDDDVACSVRSLVANSEFVSSAYSPVLHCNFECCKIHEFLAFFDWPGHGVWRDLDSKRIVSVEPGTRISEGRVSVDCAKSLGLGFGW